MSIYPATIWRVIGAGVSEKSRAEIEAAIIKVGDNAETVMKELGSQNR